MAEATKSLAAEIEAVLRKHVVGSDAKNVYRHALLTALSEAAAEVAALATAEVAQIQDENEKLRAENRDIRVELDALVQEVLKNG